MPSVEVTLSSSYASQKSLACSDNAHLIHKRAVIASALQLAAQAGATKQAVLNNNSNSNNNNNARDCALIKKPISAVTTASRTPLKTALAPSQKVNAGKPTVVSSSKAVLSSSQQTSSGKSAVVPSAKVTLSLSQQVCSVKSVLASPSKKVNGTKRVLASSRTPSGRVSVAVTGEKSTEPRKRSRENDAILIENHVLRSSASASSPPPMKRGVLTSKSSNITTPTKLTSVPKVRPIGMRKRTITTTAAARVGNGGRRSNPSIVPPSRETNTHTDWFNNKENILPFLSELADIFGPEAVQANKSNIIAALEKSLPSLHSEDLARIPLQDITRLFLNHK
ncbi:hypothetical protein BDF22DRAFT_697031 [Syncephalis plumigaleata]|nr:hypothetical protein BDF22DRAFT_697031 [Syncephalis plumigaleata]